QSSRLPELHGLRITDAQGEVTRGFGMVKGVRANLANRPYFMQLASQPGAGLVISRPVVSRVSGEWEIVLARRLQRADGAFDGVVYATIALKHFSDLFSTLDVGHRGIVALRDADLGIIVRHPVMTTLGGDVGNASVSTLTRDQVRGGQVAATFTVAAASDGIERTFSFRRITGYPMFVFVGLGTEDYLAAWKSEAAKTGALVFAFAALTLVFTVLVVRSWKRREADLQTLAIEERKFRTLLESSPDALVIVDSQEIISIVNRQALAMFGYSQPELIGSTMAMLLPERYRGLHLGSVTEASGPAIDANKDRDLWAMTKDGREFPVNISLSPIATEQGGMVAAAIRDMTERRASEEHIEFLAHHDALTGLPNRLVVQSRCEQAIAQAARSGCKVALLF
ncbi:MAG TPA: PAS domain S-box protein, partial [Casimicrobiaceae bacterium]